jgi:hypothetical protein
MTQPLRYLLIGGLATVAILVAAALLLPKPSGDGRVLGQDVPFYSMPWNDNPFYPAELQTDDGHFANPETLPSAAFCAQCHEPEYREWVSSIHAVSGPDIIYETAADNNEGAHINRAGTEKVRWCESCHEPLLVLIGEVNPIPVVGPSEAGAEGTTCIVCHTAAAADPIAGNAALELAINNINWYDEALILAAPAAHAEAMQAKSHNPLMGSADFCGACHTEIRPTVVNGDTPMHLQETYDEWRQSDYAEMGVQCQDCHMHPDPAAFIAALNETGQVPPREVSHRFVGANYLLTDANLPANLVTFLRGGHPPGPISTEAWQADLLVQQELILKLLQEAATLAIVPPSQAMPGQPLTLDVVITNSGAGHALPTGPLDQRHMWLEVQVRDGSGEVVYHNGWFDAQTGKIDPEATLYIKMLEDAAGERIVEHILFGVERLWYTRDPIPAGESDTIPYTFVVPSTAEGPLTVEVTLWYRLALQEMVTYSLGLDLIVPPVIMEQATVEIPLP